MRLPVNILAGGTDVDATSFDLPSFNWTAGRMYLLSFTPVRDDGDAPATVTTTGLTWAQIAASTGGEYSLGSGRNIWLYRAMPTVDGSGAPHLDFAGVNIFTIAWAIDEIDDVDTSGSNASGATVQTAQARPASDDVNVGATLSAFRKWSNVGYGAFSHAENETSTPGAGLKILSDQGWGSPISIRLATGYGIGITVPSVSFATSSGRGCVVAEINTRTPPEPDSRTRFIYLRKNR